MFEKGDSWFLLERDIGKDSANDATFLTDRKLTALKENK